MWSQFRSGAECTKIAHRRSLAIFTADEGIARNSAARIIFTRFHRRRNRGSLAIFFAEEIAHLGASKSRAIFPGAVKIAAAAAGNRAILVHSALGISFVRDATPMIAIPPTVHKSFEAENPPQQKSEKAPIANILDTYSLSGCKGALLRNPREMIRGRIFSEMIRIQARKSELRAESRNYGPKLGDTARADPQNPNRITQERAPNGV